MVSSHYGGQLADETNVKMKIKPRRRNACEAFVNPKPRVQVRHTASDAFVFAGNERWEMKSERCCVCVCVLCVYVLCVCVLCVCVLYVCVLCVFVLCVCVWHASASHLSVQCAEKKKIKKSI